jgi:hypothetical protein
MFNREEFEKACETVSSHYEKTAPTVSEWAEMLYRASDYDVTLADLVLLGSLAKEKEQSNYAANRVYHHMERTSASTTGHAGF